MKILTIYIFAIVLLGMAKCKQLC